MADLTEAEVVRNLAYEASIPEALDPGRLYAIPDGDGGLTILDTDKYAPRPRRVSGKAIVRDPVSFLNYYDKHSEGELRSEVWADRESSTITAVFDAPGTAGTSEEHRPGWSEHTAQLKLRHTIAWEAWKNSDGKLLPQAQFAELIEDRAVDIVEPQSATMLEIAQSFQATRKVDFESGQRLSDGELKFQYKEEVNSTAGKKGDLTIPEIFVLGLKPYEDGKAYRVKARLRWRIQDSRLVIGYKLERPEDILEDAFNEIVTEVKAGIGGESNVFFGKP